MRKHIYFVSYIIPNMGNNVNKLGFANLTLVTRSRGEKLISEAIKEVTDDDPNAIVLSICKMD